MTWVVVAMTICNNTIAQYSRLRNPSANIDPPKPKEPRKHEYAHDRAERMRRESEEYSPFQTPIITPYAEASPSSAPDFSGGGGDFAGGGATGDW